jgi:hypothetical protein
MPRDFPGRASGVAVPYRGTGRRGGGTGERGGRAIAAVRVMNHRAVREAVRG